MDEELLSIEEFAREINYSERSVRQMCIDGKIEAEKITYDARKWLIPSSALEKLKAGINLTKEAHVKPYEETPTSRKCVTWLKHWQGKSACHLFGIKTCGEICPLTSSQGSIPYQLARLK